MAISIDIVGDYGGKTGRNDLAFVEVKNRLYSVSDSKGIDCRIMSFLSTGAFNTIETGFISAQLAFNSSVKKYVVYHNTAPRKDDVSARKNNAGENLAMCMLPNGTLVIGVNAGYAFSFLKEVVPVYNVICDNHGSQFRSRDIFPQLVVDIAEEIHIKGIEITKSAYCGEVIEDIPSVPEDTILYIDGYGNIKTSIPADILNSPKVTRVMINETVQVAHISGDGIFGISNGSMVIAKGSSGWKTSKGHNSFIEISLRGGSASDSFHTPKPGDKITITHE